jgi:hypothetical protein
LGEDAKVERRVIFYHPDTGEIVSSWTFARAADATGGQRLAMEAAAKQHLAALMRDWRSVGRNSGLTCRAKPIG